MARSRKTRKSGVVKKLLFVLEVLLLLLLVAGLYLYGKTREKLELIAQPILNESEVQVNEEVLENEGVHKMTGYTTYALFGIDHRDKNEEYSGQNSDTMIIASVNNDTQEVRLVSLYRDTFLNIGSDTYAKANAAYGMGGPEQAISMLNTNLDLDISDYVTVDFKALTRAVDAIGGLDIPLTYAEMVHLNSYSKEVAEETDEDYTELVLPEPKPANIEEVVGTYHLNGVQVTSYCRIRYTGSLDMGRTERQRRVIQLFAQKAKTVGLTTLFNVLDEVFPLIQTSLRSNEILTMLPSLLNYTVANTTGFPEHFKFSDVSGSIIVATDLSGDVSELHKFLFGDDDYQPSSVVQSRSSQILNIVGGKEALLEEAPIVEEDTVDAGAVYQEDTTGQNDDYQDNYYQDNYYNNYDQGDYGQGYSDYSGGGQGGDDSGLDSGDDWEYYGGGDSSYSDYEG